MKFKVNGDEIFASTGGRPFDKNKPSTSIFKATSALGFGLKTCPMIDSLNSQTVSPSVCSPFLHTMKSYN